MALTLHNVSQKTSKHTASVDMSTTADLLTILDLMLPAHLAEDDDASIWLHMNDIVEPGANAPEIRRVLWQAWDRLRRTVTGFTGLATLMAFFGYVYAYMWLKLMQRRQRAADGMRFF